MRTGLVLVLATLILAVPLSHAQPASETKRILEWEYVVSIPDPASGNVHVEMTLRNLSGIIERVTLLTTDHRDPIANVTGTPETLLTTETGGVSFAVDSNAEKLSFDVRVVRPAFKPGEYLSWVGTDFVLFKAEALALAYTYRYFEGKPFEWVGKVKFVTPDTWRVEAPWTRDGPNAYRLPTGQVLPRGYIVMGPFDAPEEHAVAGRTLRYVRLGEAGSYEPDFVDYIDRATPYYEAVYGPGTGPHLLAINAPDPMFRGGLGATDSFFVHESADLRTLAHEYAHVFQQFSVEENPGRSAIWINEGDADYHSALSLLAAEVWSPAEVNTFLDGLSKSREDEGLATARLVDAGYGTSLERFAYHKGATVLRALDALMKRESNGAHGVADVMRRLNAIHTPDAGKATVQVSNDEIAHEAGKLINRDLSEFFGRFVLGTAWPENQPFVSEGGISLSDLVLSPARAAPGGAVHVTVKASNSGTKPYSRTLDLQVNGASVDSHALKLNVGQTTTVAFDFVAPAAGEHEIRVSYLRDTFRSLTNADLNVGRISFLPSLLRATEPAKILLFIENNGELAGGASVEALVGERTLGRTLQLTIEGNSSEATTIPVTFTRSGPLDLVFRLTTSDGKRIEKVMPILVADPDTDGDGIPDPLDAYPRNSALSERTTINDARDAIPNAALWLAALAVGVAVAVKRRGG